MLYVVAIFIIECIYSLPVLNSCAIFMKFMHPMLKICKIKNTYLKILKMPRWSHLWSLNHWWFCHYKMLHHFSLISHLADLLFLITLKCFSTTCTCSLINELSVNKTQSVRSRKGNDMAETIQATISMKRLM